MVKERTKSYEKEEDLRHVDPEYLQDEHEKCGDSHYLIPESPHNEP